MDSGGGLGFDSVGFLSAFLACFSAFLTFWADVGSMGGGDGGGGGAVVRVVASALPERATTGRQLEDRSSRRTLYSY